MKVLSEEEQEGIQILQRGRTGERENEEEKFYREGELMREKTKKRNLEGKKGPVCQIANNDDDLLSILI